MDNLNMRQNEHTKAMRKVEEKKPSKLELACKSGDIQTIQQEIFKNEHDLIDLLRLLHQTGLNTYSEKVRYKLMEFLYDNSSLSLKTQLTLIMEKNPFVKTLNLTRKKLYPKIVGKIIESISDSPHLVKIDFSQNKFDHDSLLQLLKAAITCPNLECFTAMKCSDENPINTIHEAEKALISGAKLSSVWIDADKDLPPVHLKKIELIKQRYLELLTSLLYELKRHDWNHPQCEWLVFLIQKKSFLPENIRNVLDNKDNKALYNIIENEERSQGTFFGENLSDDSDDIHQQNFTKLSKKEKEEKIEQPHQLSRKIINNLFLTNTQLESIVNRLIKLEKSIENFLKHKAKGPYSKDIELDVRLILDQSKMPAIHRFKSAFGRNLRELKEELEKTITTDIKRKKAILNRVFKNVLQDTNIFSVLVSQTDDINENLFIELKSLLNAYQEIDLTIKRCIEDKSYLSSLPFVDKPSTQQIKDLDTINEAMVSRKNIETTFENIQNDFVICAARGVTYATHIFNQPARQAHRAMQEINRPQFSAAVYRHAGVGLFRKVDPKRHITEEESDNLFRSAKKFKTLMVEMKSSGPVSYQGRSFRNLNYLLQHFYSNSYDSIPQLMKDIKAFLLKNNVPNQVANLLEEDNIFMSLGMAKHATAYANGKKSYAGLGEKCLRPRWRKDGRAERPKTGKIYGMLYPLKSLLAYDGYNYVPKLSQERDIFVNSQIVAEHEIAFYAYLEEGHIPHTYIAKYPSFAGEHQEIHQMRYGLSKEHYDAYKKGILETKPHSISRKSVERILEEWLTLFQAFVIHDQAFTYALDHQQVLVYPNKEGQFSFKPESASIRESDANLNRREEHLKYMASEKGGIRHLKESRFNKYWQENEEEMQSQGKHFRSIFKFNNQMSKNEDDYIADDESEHSEPSKSYSSSGTYSLAYFSPGVSDEASTDTSSEDRRSLAEYFMNHSG